MARAIVRVSIRDETARVSTPLLYPGGGMVGVEISRRRDGFLVTDAGGARREAGLWGGERTFARIAPEVADHHGVRFDRDMMFDLDVAQPDLPLAVIAVANAAQVAVERTALQLASQPHADHRAMLWDRLDRLFGATLVARSRAVRGASEDWTFDAVVETAGRLALFELVLPHAVAVGGAVTKFLDIRDLGDNAPGRVAVLADKAATPHLAVLSRTATIVAVDDPDTVLAAAA